jgi:undecaprenyl-diphosphatase
MWDLGIHTLMNLWDQLKSSSRSSAFRLLAGSFLAALCFAAVALLVSHGNAQAFDDSVLSALRNPRDVTDPLGPFWLEEGIRDISALGSTTFLMLLALICACFFCSRGEPLSAFFTLGGYAGALVLNNLLKAWFARPRPASAEHLHLLSYSFPSGHSLLSAFVYMLLAALIARKAARRRDRLFAIGAGLALTGLVGLSRIYLGMHFPSDVLAGWLAGMAWAMICGLVMGLLERGLGQAGSGHSSASLRP